MPAEILLPANQIDGPSRMRRLLAGRFALGVAAGVLVFGSLAVLWGLFVGLELSKRGTTLTKAHRDLAALTRSFADYAGGLSQIRGDDLIIVRPLDPARDRETIDSFYATLSLQPGAHLRLWSTETGAFLGGDQPGPNDRAPKPDEIAPRQGLLSAVAVNRIAGVEAVADLTEEDALAQWRLGALEESALLVVLTTVVIILGLLLLPKLRRWEVADARWRALFENASDGVFLLRVDHKGDHVRFVLETVNPSGARTAKLVYNRHKFAECDALKAFPLWARDAASPELQACL